MKYSFKCPRCGRRITAAGTKHVGAQKPCPSCQKPLTIPAPPTEDSLADDTDAIVGEVIAASDDPSVAATGEPNFDFGMDLPALDSSATPVQPLAQPSAFASPRPSVHSPQAHASPAAVSAGGVSPRPDQKPGPSRSKTFWIVGGIAAASALVALLGITTVAWWMMRGGSGNGSTGSLASIFSDGYPNDDGMKILFDTPEFRDVVWRETQATGMSEEESQKVIADYRKIMLGMAADFGLRPDSDGNYAVPPELGNQEPSAEDVEKTFSQFGLELPDWCDRLTKKLQDKTIQPDELRVMYAAGLLKLLQEQS